MRIAWGLVALAAVVGCGDRKKEDEKGPIIREEEIAAPLQPREPAVVAPDEPAVADVVTPPSTPPSSPECIEDSKIVSWDPKALRACFDSNEDGDPDRCVQWQRDGKVELIHAAFGVEKPDALRWEPPVEVRSSDDDDRITIGDSSIEICPFDHACLRIMPRLETTELLSVLTDRDYKRGLFLLKEQEEEKAWLEIWDLDTGRMRARTPMKARDESEVYEFSAKLGSGIVLGFAENMGGRSYGSIFTLDGRPRGEIAGGSRNLDLEKTFQHAGMFGIVDIGPEDVEKPYVLHLVSLATGAASGKITIKREQGGDGDLDLGALPNNLVGITQFGTQLRLDLLDLRTRTTKTLFAPGC